MVVVAELRLLPEKGSKLQRSRRLSSTRGLNTREEKRSVPYIGEKSTLGSDLEKLEFCPMESNEYSDEGRVQRQINWELNEQISLSSDLSMGIEVYPDKNKGIEFRESRKMANLEDHTSIESNAGNKKGSDEIKPSLNLMSESKYNPSKNRKPTAHQVLIHTRNISDKDKDDDEVIVTKGDPKYECPKILSKDKLSRCSLKKKSCQEDTRVSVNPRSWLEAKQKIDKTNQAISKRLELIRGLNKKLLTNYDDFQQKSRRCHSVHNSAKIKQAKKKDINASATKESRSELVENKLPQNARVCHDSDNNFSLIAKPYFSKDRHGKANVTHISVNFRSDENHQRVDSCELYRGKNIEMYNKPERFGKTWHQNDCESPKSWSRAKTKSSLFHGNFDKISLEGSNDFNNSTQQKILEKKVLCDFIETINKYECDPNEETISTDSIRNSTPIMKTTEGTLENSPVLKQQTVINSSWNDSGVGVEIGVASGWVRVHMGIESSLVYLTLDTTTKDVCRDMLLTKDLSIFVQYDGEAGRRLLSHEKPLEIQDKCLQQFGYEEPSRRARFGIYPELRYLIAFHVGPAAPLEELVGYNRCGHALILKGLVFPQWKKRALAVIGSRLLLYPACPDNQPEWMELGGGGGAVCHAPSRLGKLVLRVTGFPRIAQKSQQSEADSESSRQDDAHYQETRHLYLGFHHSWDRDLWRSWLKQATQLSACPRKLDLSKGGLSRIPDGAIAFPAIEELMLGQNQLTNSNSNLIILHRFPRLRVVHIESNNLIVIPRELLELKNLTRLDISDNKIQEVPPEINGLINLKELILDRNELKDLPKELEELQQLKNLSLAGNSLIILPPILNMRTLIHADVHCSKGDCNKTDKVENNNPSNLNKVNLRNNQLRGNIILGNYGNLVHLDVSENDIEKLDVSALEELRYVRCARNVLTELTLCGKNLVSLIAGNNKLKKLIIEPIPTNLEHLDVSYNELDALPEWITELPHLRVLFASHNILTALPDKLFSQPSKLEVLHLPHNRLQALPPPRRPLNIVHLTLQGNVLTALPISFFANTEKLKVLNLSNNRLLELPYNEEMYRNRRNPHMLEKLYLTGNCLTDTALDTLAKFSTLRVLHMAYNVLDTLPESCIASWSELEELVLSGNRLQYLPDNVANLQHLQVLRVHSNRLLTCPAFYKTSSLKVLDVAHNQLDRINLSTLVPPQLQFLDISCNTRLHVDPRQFQVYRSQRPVSLVDVSGQNRLSLPASPHGQEIATADKFMELPWRLGFSETAGTQERLFISQVRMPSFCNFDGLFGVFDGGRNQEAPNSLQEIIPRLLLEERTIKETSKEYLKYTMLSAHRELKEKGQKYGIDGALVHLTKQFNHPNSLSTSSSSSSSSSSPVPSVHNYTKTTNQQPYCLKVASCGEAKAVLCRAAGPLILAPKDKNRSHAIKQLCNSATFPVVVPDVVSEEVMLEEDDEFIIIGSKQLWEVLGIQDAVKEARAEANPVLAAKRLQDLAQAYGAEENLSIIVVRLNGPRQGENFNKLIKEFGQVANKNWTRNDVTSCSCPCCIPTTNSKSSPAPCCCHVSEGYYLNCVIENILNRSSKPQNSSGPLYNIPQTTREKTEDDNIICGTNRGDDRSSPSGQSDQTTSESTFKFRNASSRTWNENTTAKATSKVCQNLRSQENSRKLSTCRSPTQENGGNSSLSDEQFRCWEYMLEQNTQLLFDKELDTLTTVGSSCSRNNLLRRSQSKSTPHLSTITGAGTGSNSHLILPPAFLGSKRFGSARSFDPGFRVRGTKQPIPRFGGTSRRLLNTGPNAAYFGSLQRLMPYNLEYDFAVIQERSTAMDSLEQDASRMQQYWGIATTEL